MNFRTERYPIKAGVLSAALLASVLTAGCQEPTEYDDADPQAAEAAFWKSEALTSSNGMGTNGMGTNGMGTNGMGTNGMGTNGLGTNGAFATWFNASIALN